MVRAMQQHRPKMTTTSCPPHGSQQVGDPSEPVILHAWRVRLCARGLREALDRIQRAAAGGGLTFRQALAIARSMDSAIATLERTASNLDARSELRTLSDAALAAFASWRVAPPRSAESTNAGLDLGAKVHALEALATKASTPGSKEALAESRANLEDMPERSKSISTTSPELKSSPFATLESRRGELPEANASPAPQNENEHERDVPLNDKNDKIVIRKTRKGRGGKTVTVIAGITDAKRRDELAKELRTALGCGVKAQGGEIIAQGAQEVRVREFLEARGATRVVMGT